MPPLCESHRFYANRIAVIVCVERHRRYRGERFDTGGAGGRGAASDGEPLGFRRSSALGKKNALKVSGISQNARSFHGRNSLGTRRQGARLFQRRQRFGLQIGFGPRVVLLMGHGT